MGSNDIILLVVFNSCGILLWLIGSHIKKSQAIESIWLPGLVLKDVKDKKGLATFVGNSLTAMGIISMLIGASIFLLPTIKMVVLLMFLIALVAICLTLVLGLRKFRK